jgi:hypothetical protein
MGEEKAGSEEEQPNQDSREEKRERTGEETLEQG